MHIILVNFICLKFVHGANEHPENILNSSNGDSDNIKNNFYQLIDQSILGDNGELLVPSETTIVFRPIFVYRQQQKRLQMEEEERKKRRKYYQENGRLFSPQRYIFV